MVLERQGTSRNMKWGDVPHLVHVIDLDGYYDSISYSKSAHTALAVKACLLGCNSATLNAQVTFVYIAVAISALAGGGGGALKNFAPKPFLCWCFRNFFGGLDLKRVLRWNFGSFWGGSGNRKTDLGGFRQRKNGQQ